MYAKIENGAVVKYPYSYEDLKRENPQTSWPTSMPIERLNEYGIHIVVAKGQPSHNPITHRVVESNPSFNATKQQWEQTWALVEYTPQQMVENQAAAVAKLTAEVVEKTQERLDEFARTRNYDGILSAASYAVSSHPPFASEGRYCADARDATWGTLYTIMAEVQAGTRPMPSGYADIEPALPVLEWPSS